MLHIKVRVRKLYADWTVGWLSHWNKTNKLTDLKHNNDWWIELSYRPGRGGVAFKAFEGQNWPVSSHASAHLLCTRKQAPCSLLSITRRVKEQKEPSLPRRGFLLRLTWRREGNLCDKANVWQSCEQRRVGF